MAEPISGEQVRVSVENPIPPEIVSATESIYYDATNSETKPDCKYTELYCRTSIFIAILVGFGAGLDHVADDCDMINYRGRKTKFAVFWGCKWLIRLCHIGLLPYRGYFLYRYLKNDFPYESDTDDNWYETLWFDILILSVVSVSLYELFSSAFQEEKWRKVIDKLHEHDNMIMCKVILTPKEQEEKNKTKPIRLHMPAHFINYLKNRLPHDNGDQDDCSIDFITKKNEKPHNKPEYNKFCCVLKYLLMIIYQLLASFFLILFWSLNYEHKYYVAMYMVLSYTAIYLVINLVMYFYICMVIMTKMKKFNTAVGRLNQIYKVDGKFEFRNLTKVKIGFDHITDLVKDFDGVESRFILLTLILLVMIFGHNLYMIVRFFFNGMKAWEHIIENWLFLFITPIIMLMIFTMAELIDDAGKGVKKLTEEFFLNGQKKQNDIINPTKRNYQTEQVIINEQDRLIFEQFNDHSELFTIIKMTKSPELSMAGWGRMSFLTIFFVVLNFVIKHNVLMFVWDKIIADSTPSPSNITTVTGFNISTMSTTPFPTTTMSTTLLPTTEEPL